MLAHGTLINNRSKMCSLKPVHCTKQKQSVQNLKPKQEISQSAT